jgi:hypothetical protein
MASVKDGHGVHPDGTILHPALQETVWFDKACTHTTCMSHLEAEVKHHTITRRATGRDGARMPFSRLLEEYQIKLDRYSSSPRSLRGSYLTVCAWWPPWFCPWC